MTPPVMTDPVTPEGTSTPPDCSMLLPVAVSVRLLELKRSELVVNVPGEAEAISSVFVPDRKMFGAPIAPAIDPPELVAQRPSLVANAGPLPSRPLVLAVEVVRLYWPEPVMLSVVPAERE